MPPAPTPHQVTDLPDQFIAEHAVGSHPARAWWHGFEDPAVNRVVEAALVSNLDLKQAVARVEQARARARIAAASQLPMVQATLGATGFDVPTNAGIGAQLEELGLGPDAYASFGVALPDRLGLSTYAFGTDFAYELDFWGRNRNAALAAGAERLASEADYRAAQIGVVAETIATYLETVDLRRQDSYYRQIAALLGQQDSLARLRYNAGLIDIQALYDIRRGVSSANANSAEIAARLADAEARLWVLLGGYATDLESILPDAQAPPVPQTEVPSGIPADRLVQRPDIHAARQRLEAARYALGAHRAALLPSLSLSGSIGLESSDSGDWFDPDQWYRNLSANLLAPVFQGGRLRGNVALARARLDEAAAAFGKSVVTAVNEVDAALAGWRANRLRLSMFVSLAEEAQAEADLFQQRYLGGVADFDHYLAASQRALGAQAGLSRATRDLGLARLAVHRALGGGWSASDAPTVGRGGKPADAAQSAPDGLRARLRALWERLAPQSSLDTTE